MHTPAGRGLIDTLVLLLAVSSPCFLLVMRLDPGPRPLCRVIPAGVAVTGAVTVSWNGHPGPGSSYRGSVTYLSRPAPCLGSARDGSRQSDTALGRCPLRYWPHLGESGCIAPL